MKFNKPNHKPKTRKNRSKAFCLRIILALVLVISFSFYAYLYLHYTTPILMYHSFDASRIKDFAAVSLEDFQEQMKVIKKNGYTKKFYSKEDTYFNIGHYKDWVIENILNRYSLELT